MTRRRGVCRACGASSRLLAPTQDGAPSLPGSCSLQLSSHHSWGQKNTGESVTLFREDVQRRKSVYNRVTNSWWRNSHLFSTIDESLLLRWDPFLLFHPLFNSLHLHLNKNTTFNWESTVNRSGCSFNYNYYYNRDSYVSPCLWAQCRSLFLSQWVSETQC